MKKTPLLFALCLFLFGAAQTIAQTPPPPPPVLLLVREDIKPGKMPAHEQEASAYIQVLDKANSMITDKNLRDGRIAMSPVAGNENEVAYLWPYQSFADMESKRKAMDKLTSGALKADFDQLPDRELHAAQRDIIASFRPDLSYGIGTVDIAQARYMVMNTVRLKPGHDDEYWEAYKKLVNPARDKAQVKASYAVYQVRAGAPGGTYLVFRPLKAMSELDFPLRAVGDAMGKDGREDMARATDKAVLGTDTVYYAINPRLSHVAPEFAARDTSSPGFWNPRSQAATTAAMTTATARKKANAKRSGNQP